MYFMMMCQTPRGAKSALTSYAPDNMPDGFPRDWAEGRRFASPPSTPVRVDVEQGESGILLEMMTGAIPLMSRRLADVLSRSGVANIEFYDAAIHDLESGAVHTGHVAFNIVGAIAAADLGKSVFDDSEGSLIAVDFDSLTIDATKTRGALVFRLAESINGIAVHERIVDAIEEAGIDSLTFLPPEDWVG